jgi:Fe-S-cluster-containing dehydrogenase component/DMSO reductase anchor subunit
MPAETQPAPADVSTLLSHLLARHEQTAVVQFAQWHGGLHAAHAPRASAENQLAARYRALLPLTLPAAGEQYGFEVDLDACSGCKACVAACHQLNGLDEGESWRTVGLLHGGTERSWVVQHVTAACHHCLEPACLTGCPVEAYEKDPITGIVRHLDDQCIGCQYCVLMCPYDVPRYHADLGIVRKCDMCRQRLAAGEPPACVQACPNRAIRITLVQQAAVAETAEANLFLPAAPDPARTLPTTIYKTRRGLPANMLPADYYHASPQHAHWPLVWMLILTQMSVGAFVIGQLVGVWSPGAVTQTGSRLQQGMALGLGLLGLAASVLHLGRPHLAYRAILGWRRSWLSREVLAYAAFAVLAGVGTCVGWSASSWAGQGWSRWLNAAACASGVAGVCCSAMIYASTGRPYWRLAFTGPRFLLSCVVLGAPLVLAIRLAAAWTAGWTPQHMLDRVGSGLCVLLAAAGAAKLAGESLIFAALRSRTFHPMRRTALLLVGELGPLTLQRFVLGVAGAVSIPLLLVLGSQSEHPPSGLAATLAVLLALAACAAGEAVERLLFLRAVVAPRMPGAPAV